MSVNSSLLPISDSSSSYMMIYMTIYCFSLDINFLWVLTVYQKTLKAITLLFIDFGDIPPVAAQDVINVLKQGYLEKKRKGTATSRHQLRANF